MTNFGTFIHQWMVFIRWWAKWRLCRRARGPRWSRSLPASPVPLKQHKRTSNFLWISSKTSKTNNSVPKITLQGLLLYSCVSTSKLLVLKQLFRYWIWHDEPLSEGRSRTIFNVNLICQHQKRGKQIISFVKFSTIMYF